MAEKYKIACNINSFYVFVSIYAASYWPHSAKFWRNTGKGGVASAKFWNYFDKEEAAHVKLFFDDEKTINRALEYDFRQNIWKRKK